MRGWWAVLVVATGCNRGVIVHPDLPDGTTLTVDFDLAIGGRVVIEGFTAFSEVKGLRTVTVTDGALVERTTSLRVAHKVSDGELAWESTSAEPPATPLVPEVSRFWGVERRHVIGERGLTTELGDVSTLPGANAADLELLLQPVLAAPAGRLRQGDHWWVEVRPESEPGAGDAWYRTWTIMDATDRSAVLVEEVNVKGDPVDGELPDERGQRRSMTHVDGRTGRPADYRMRDLGSKLVGVDVTASFTWE